MQKGCKKDFNKNQYTKKFVFQCHTVTHGIDMRKSPQAQQKKGQKIALFDQIKLKNEPKNQFQSVFFA